MRATDHYENNLRHIVRPDDMDERRDAPSVTLSDYEALYLSKALSEYAAYECERGSEYQGIALGFAEYINMVVRDEDGQRVVLFAHTPEARMVLADAIDAHSHQERDLHGSVKSPLDDLWVDGGDD